MMISINIDGCEINAYEGQTIFEAADANNIEIPTLCNDSHVIPEGACGICVVEVEGSAKLLRACATSVTSGMVISTRSARVIASRRAVLELILSTHTGDCRPPCMLACPAQTDCQGYISLIANGQYREAVKLMKDAHPLPASIGRVCPHPCESECRRRLADEPVSIAGLKTFAADLDLSGDEYIPETRPDTGITVAIAGGGPAGLTAAYFLKRAGHHAVVYDIMPKMGGLLRYGIPEYRLPKAVLDAEIRVLARMGIVFINETGLGRDITLQFLQDKYDAVVVATGAGISKKLNIPGEELPGVLGGIDFLRDAALQKPLRLGKRVAVIGGSNTAMDAARTAIRLGATEVYVIYRRTREEMPADPTEIQEAEDEGVRFRFLSAPVAIAGNGQVENVTLQTMQLGEPDASGRRMPVAVPGALTDIAADTVIAAIGQDVNRYGLEDLPAAKYGALAADTDYSTPIPGVYAIGDATGQSAYAIEAIGHARTAAAAVHSYLMKQEASTAETPLWEVLPGVLVKDTKTEADYAHEPRLPREQAAKLAHGEAVRSFTEISRGLTAEQAAREAQRCLSCGCGDFFACRLLRYANEYGADTCAYTGKTYEKPAHEPESFCTPFIRRNPDKCILCGLCVRVCDQTMGCTALGLVNRGFNTAAAPPDGLDSADCIACGQCASLCPTGALLENQPLHKPLTAREDTYTSVCAFCSVGCRLKLHTKGRLLLRCTADTTHDPSALLCAKGRFGFGLLNNANTERLTLPLLRDGNDHFTETSWEDACNTVRSRIQSIISVYGPGSVGVAVCDHYPTEDLSAILDYAHRLTPHVFSFNAIKSGLAAVTGRNASTGRFDALQHTDVIILIADDILSTHTVAAMHIKKATENGAKLIIINKNDDDSSNIKSIRRRKAAEFFAQYTDLLLTSDDSLTTLRQIAKAVMDLTSAPDESSGYETLRAYLESATPSEAARKAASAYVKARHAMIVFDQASISESAAVLLADIAVLAGHLHRPHSGIIQLKPNSNSQGLADLGIDTEASRYIQMIRENTLRGLLIFGEDVPFVDLSSLAFLMVQDSMLTKTARQADVVLPAAAFSESGGHYTDTTGVTKEARTALAPASGLLNRQVIRMLAGDDASHRNTYETPTQETGSTIVPEGKIRLITPETDDMYAKHLNTHYLHRRFMEENLSL